MARQKSKPRRARASDAPDDPEVAARREEVEREVRKRMAFAQVRQYPDRALRMRAYEVEQFDEDLARIAGRMGELMQAAQGVGLAAPQIGLLQRVIVYQADPETEGVTTLVNPRVVERSPDTEVAEEGCLSLDQAGVQVDVERSAAVSIAAQTLLGEEIRVEAEGLEARIIQHELDHLDGILIIDRTTPEHRRRALGELRARPELGPMTAATPS